MVVVPELRYVTAREGDDDSGDHPVKGIRESDEPHLPRGDPFVDRISTRESCGDASSFFPRQAKRIVVEDVDMESASGVDDR